MICISNIGIKGEQQDLIWENILLKGAFAFYTGRALRMIKSMIFRRNVSLKVRHKSRWTEENKESWREKNQLNITRCITRCRTWFANSAVHFNTMQIRAYHRNDAAFASRLTAYFTHVISKQLLTISAGRDHCPCKMINDPRRDTRSPLCKLYVRAGFVIRVLTT